MVLPVFCCECKWLVEKYKSFGKDFKGESVVGPVYRCESPCNRVIKENTMDWLSCTYTNRNSPTTINKDNNCEWFERN